MGKISEEKNNVGDNNEERDTFNEDIKETSNRVRLRKPKKKVSRFFNCNGCPSKNPDIKTPLVASFLLGAVINFSPLAAC